MKKKESKQVKKEKLTESLHLTLALNENLQTFSTVSSFIVQFNKSQFRRLEGYFAVTKEIAKIVNSSQAYKSAECQMTVLQKLLIILRNHMNVSTINQLKSLPQVLGY